MLPPEAKTYFDSLSSASNADAWSELARRQKSFERDEFARGHAPAGAGFSARLAALYAESLTARAREIVEMLKTVHQSFNSPLDEGVDVQLRDWGARALSDARQGLEGGYLRHLQSFGIDPAHASGFSHAYALAQATVGTLPSRYLWELRNVPTKRPQPPASAQLAPVVINNSGTIGALQTGAGSSTNVQQWVGGDTSELRAALAALRETLERAQDVEADQRSVLVADVDGAVIELQQDKPNKGKLLRWLGGIGAVVQTAASVKPAYEAVQAVARALGLPL
ncbi:MAG: hypothetical protein V4795_06705 [Pseudomonadota bacterium]